MKLKGFYIKYVSKDQGRNNPSNLLSYENVGGNLFTENAVLINVEMYGRCWKTQWESGHGHRQNDKMTLDILSTQTSNSEPWLKTSMCWYSKYW